MSKHIKKLNSNQAKILLSVLHERFKKNVKRHQALSWEMIVDRLETHQEKLWSLNQMEITGGEPDVIAFDKKSNKFIFCDCSAESPKGRRSICYDQEALMARKENKPANSAVNMAEEMGIELLSEEQYRQLQSFGPFDTKTSSWVKTPENVRKLGGALFCDYRYGQVFLYHNGAESYYAARGFRGCITL